MEKLDLSVRRQSVPVSIGAATEKEQDEKVVVAA